MNKIVSFQGLRGIAILLIFLSHCNYCVNEHGTNPFGWFGACGVSLFIIMSGYLTANKYYGRSSIPDLGTYFKKKVKRFLPLHIITLIASLPLSFDNFEGNIYKEGIRFIINLFLLQSWMPVSGIYFSFNSVSWYLSAAIFFIILSPALMKVLEKMSDRKLYAALGAAIGFEFFWSYLTGRLSIAHWLIYICPIVRFFDYFIGAGLCVCLKRCSNKYEFKRIYLDLVLIVMIFAECMLLAVSTNSVSESFSSASWMIPSVCIISILGIYKYKSLVVDIIFKNPFIVFIGNISFEFFLIHQLVIRYMSFIYKKISLENHISLYIIAFLLSIFLSVYIKKLAGNKNIYISSEY